MTSPSPTREQGDLADMVEMLLDKGVVINADIAVSVGDTKLLGVQVRAALASFETAAEYGLEFPEGTDMERVEAAASGHSRLAGGDEGTKGAPTGDSDADVDADADEDDGGGADGGTDEPTTTPGGSDHVSVRPHATADHEEGDDGDG